MQSNGDSSVIDVDWQDVVVDPIVNGLDGVFENNLVGWITDAWDLIINDFLGYTKSYIEGLFEALLGPIIGTPAPEGPASPAPLDIAFNSATNSPWTTLISDVYFGGIVGLALGVQFITWAIIGVRFGSINPVVRKKLGRRCLIAFLSLFFWLPVASLATQFFDILGRHIVLSGYTSGDAVDTLLSLGEITSTNWGAGLLLLVVAAYVYLKALFIFIARWIMTILLTVAMPLVASVWVLEVWPFSRFGGLSKQIAGAYPGLLAAGLPPAILIRISLATTDFGLDGLSFFVATISVYLAAKMQKIMIRRSSSAAMRVSEQVLAGAKKPVKIGGAAAGAVATAGAGAVGGSTAAMTTGRAINTVSSVAKGRPGRAARNVQMLHRDLSTMSKAGGSSISQSTTSSASASGGAGQTQKGSQSGGTSSRTPQTATNSAPRSGSTPADSTDSATTTSQGRLPSDGDASPHWSADQQGNVTYWDVVDSGVTVEDSPGSKDAEPVPSRVEETASDDSRSASPAAASDGDRPDNAGTGQTDPSFKDVFADGNGPLGPTYYRDNSGTNGS